MASRRPGEPGANPRSRLPLGDIFGWVAMILGVLTMVMLFVWAYSMTCFLSTNFTTCDPMHTVWTPLTWSITWWLAAARGMVGLVTPGLLLCVRPALLGPNWGAPVDRRWHIPAGLARLWAGLGITIIAVFLALYSAAFMALPLPVNRWSIIASIITLLAVPFGPLYALMVTEFLVRRVWR